jgi:rfaE bifunctional protein nucleotidyltransferase chain/domain|tara:strand:- start:187 stop:660 length:474 start_codon:yes stop_codon:yes gene_type:complete
MNNHQYQLDHSIDAITSDKQCNKKIVFTNGCFDILHVGHIRYLSEARSLGDILVVGVNSDESVRNLKGPSRPINSLSDRALLLSELACVDYVVSFKEQTPLKLIKMIMPDILVKGGDYTLDTVVGSSEVIDAGGKVELLKFHDGYSSTNYIDKIKKH